jgi:hypothetical protein
MVSISGVGGSCIPRDGSSADITITGDELDKATPAIVLPVVDKKRKVEGEAEFIIWVEDTRFGFTPDPDPGNINSKLYKTSVQIVSGQPDSGPYALGMMQNGSCVAVEANAVNVC